MRSRNGNHSFLYAICTIVVLSFVSLLNADEYLISYRYVAKDAFSFSESLQVSHAMRPCAQKQLLPLILENEDNNLKKTLLKNFDLFFEYAQKLGLHIQHHDLTTKFQNTSMTIMTLKTTCFKVEFNDKSAIIYALE